MKKIIIMLIVVSSILFLPKSVSANSALKSYEGYDGNGVYLIDEAPIKVLNEDLNFYINQNDVVPYDSYFEENAYNNYFSAKYTFQNESDVNVKAHLVFPFGSVNPYYTEFDDTYLYDLKTNGLNQDYKLRYTYKDDYYEFDFARDIASLSDEYISNYFGGSEKFYKVELEVLSDNFFIYNFEGYNVISSRDDSYYFENKYHIGGYIYDDSRVVTFYFINNYDSDILSHITYYNRQLDNACTEVTGSATIKNIAELNLEEFLLEGYDSESTCSKVDYYNAKLYKFIDCSQSRRQEWENTTLYFFDNELNSSELLRWFDYELDFEPNGTLTNEVIAPIYPDIHQYFEPVKYTYNYYLTPAQTFSSFESLNIYIHTDSYLLESSHDFTKEDFIYEYHADNLGDNDLYFTLCLSEEPERYSYGCGSGFATLLLSFLGFCALIIFLPPLIMSIIAFFKSLKNKTSKENHLADITISSSFLFRSLMLSIGLIFLTSYPSNLGLIIFLVIYIIGNILIFIYDKTQNKVLRKIRLIFGIVSLLIILILFVLLLFNNIVGNIFLTLPVEFFGTLSIFAFINLAMFDMITYYISYRKNHEILEELDGKDLF